jgi:hypothetical protein
MGTNVYDKSLNAKDSGDGEPEHREFVAAVRRIEADSLRYESGERIAALARQLLREQRALVGSQADCSHAFSGCSPTPVAYSQEWGAVYAFDLSGSRPKISCFRQLSNGAEIVTNLAVLWAQRDAAINFRRPDHPYPTITAGRSRGIAADKFHQTPQRDS